MVNISAFVTVKETDYHYVGKETFHFQSTGLKTVVGDDSGTPVKVGAMETYCEGHFHQPPPSATH